MKLVELFEQSQHEHSGYYQIELLDPQTKEYREIELKCYYKIVKNVHSGHQPFLDFEYAELENDFEIGNKKWTKGMVFNFENFDEFKPFMDIKDYMEILDDIGSGDFLNF